MLEFLVRQVVQALHDDAQQRLVMTRLPFMMAVRVWCWPVWNSAVLFWQAICPG
jgi:hypothetical protein